MDLTQTLTLATAALLMFWMVGAYNRLVALRSAVARAGDKLGDAQRLRAESAAPLLAALQAPLAAEQGALKALSDATAASHRSTAALVLKPLDAGRAVAWQSAEAQLQAAASRVFALLELNAALRSDAAAHAALGAWRDGDKRLAFARALFNEAAASYDAAIALFPTRLLLPLFGFGQAGRV